MTDAAPVRTGVLVWNQYTDSPALRGAAITVDRLGYDSLWTWDHLYPIVGSRRDPSSRVVSSLWSRPRSIRMGRSTWRASDASSTS